MSFLLHLKQFLVQGRCIELFVPDVEEVQAAYKKEAIAFPYWSQVWPAAIALSEFLLSHPQYTHNKKVLELAGGLGLPSIIAARNAVSVISSDYIPEAVEAIQRSAKHNGIKNLRALTLDWHSLPQDIVADVLLLSDINYDPAVFALQQQLINSFLNKGTIVILSTPQRLVAKEFITPLSSSCIVQEEVAVEKENEQVLITVMVLRKG
ncbi:MAG: methyltransferase protein [Flavisolibacter sp.]|nr:methyltransferase protein [Flavisolibacter sp.]